MAIAVDEHAVVKLVDNVLSARVASVRNDGPNAVKISKDPQVAAAGGFAVALNGVQSVSLSPGQALYGICAAGQTASLEVI